MAFPALAVLNVASLLSFAVSGWGWFKRVTGISEQPASTMPLVTTTPFAPSTAPLPIKHPFRKTNNDLLSTLDSTDRTTTISTTPAPPSSGSLVGFILILVLVVAVIAFVVYRKRSQRKANQLEFRQSERNLESPPSPGSTRSGHNRMV